MSVVLDILLVNHPRRAQCVNLEMFLKKWRYQWLSEDERKWMPTLANLKSTVGPEFLTVASFMAFARMLGPQK